ncbi:MAG: hypothetical protein M1819_003357 [Sarea resinae]|nr:MAG: hypothetical protein M1819_003357 [Sarea resinae]
MAPPRTPREPSIERSTEYEEFMAKLTAYHEERGTTDVFNPQPRIGNRHADLYKLYKAVTERGGYDNVTAERLWKVVGQELKLVIGPQSGHAQLTYMTKTAYYKNLAAYEISTFHKKEPPPRNILEDVSAGGGGLLNRTTENYVKPGRDSTSFADGQQSSGSEDEASKTPKDAKTEQEDPGSGAGRVTRGLRQAPPQRVLFQPDVSSSRQTRHSTTSSAHSPQPAATTYNSVYAPRESSVSLFTNYEPKPPTVLTLRPVITPSNNPGLFQEQQRRQKEAAAAKSGKTAQNYKGMMLPGTGFEGPNIYVRTLLALRSGIPEEQNYALHHLVKISHERGDKYKFEAFPGLAEGLIEKALEVSSVFYDVKWEISFKDDGSMHPTHTLDGIRGTKDILRRLQDLMRIEPSDEMETAESSQRMNNINEAGLVLRNMVTLEDNAEYLSRLFPVRDFICIVLNLPPRSSVVELQHYALDIAEHLTKYFALEADDPFYLSLLAQLKGDDRGKILTALRAISRLSMNLEENNHLRGVPLSTIQLIFQWTLIDDEELVNACLDFLYQYTAVADNVEAMLEGLNVDALINQCVRLLLYGAKETEAKSMTKAPLKGPPATEIPQIPRDLLEQLLQYDEPERSAHWLRASFEEDPHSDITQIALWQAYQARFAEFITPQRMLLPAADFIKNVSTTFAGANAQVLNGPVQKFIIKGIRPRRAPMDPQGRLYTRCLWTLDNNRTCGAFLPDAPRLWTHILSHHLRVPFLPNSSSQFSLTPPHTLSRPYTCRWSTCHLSPPLPSSASAATTQDPFKIGQHIKTHLPSTTTSTTTSDPAIPTWIPNQTPSSRAGLHPNKRPDKHFPSAPPNANGDIPGEFRTQIWLNTATDERGDAAGVPLTAVLVLRNIARNLPRPRSRAGDALVSGGNSAWLGGAGIGAGRGGPGAGGAGMGDAMDEDGLLDATTDADPNYMIRLFGPVRERLWYVMAHNRPLAGYLADLNAVIAEGGG